MDFHTCKLVDSSLMLHFQLIDIHIKITDTLTAIEIVTRALLKKYELEEMFAEIFAHQGNYLIDKRYSIQQDSHIYRILNPYRILDIFHYTTKFHSETFTAMVPKVMKYFRTFDPKQFKFLYSF